MGDQNLSLVLKKKENLCLEDRPIPEPHKNEVLIAISCVGICGSDVHYWTHGQIGSFIVKEPILLGHESSGTVVKLGEGVTNLKIGDRVAIEPGVPCRSCELCLLGRYNLCPDIQFLATPPVNGDLCRYHVHDASFCFKLPDHVTLEEGALLEPLSVGVHACRRAGVTLGSVVLIMGAGPIGLVNLLVAKSMGASKVFITDLSEQRLAVAKEMGADGTFLVGTEESVEDLVKRLQNETEAEPSISIECTGVQTCISFAIRATKSGGCVVLVGLGPSIYLTLPVVDAAVREVDIRGIFRYSNCYPAALSLVSQGRVDVKQLITHRFSLEQSVEAFNTALNASKTNAIKVMIQCNKI